MSEAPKCTSWLGHKFEARYSLGAARERTFDEEWWTPWSQRLQTIEMSRRQQYEGDGMRSLRGSRQPPVSRRCRRYLTRQPAALTLPPSTRA